MAKQKGKHESDKNQRQAYKNEGRHAENRLRKLRRLLKEQPNNKVLADRLAELEKSGVPYRRNRRATLPGSRRSPWKTKRNWDAFRTVLEMIPSTVPEYKIVLTNMWANIVKNRKPKIRVKRGKYNRVSKAS